MSVPPWPIDGTEEYDTLIGGHPVEHDSAALLDDGRVIYQYTTGNNLWQAYYPHWVAFCDANDALATTPYSITSSINPSAQRPRSSVFRMPDGGLYMSLIYGLGGANYFQIWQSTSGTGESSPGVPDWFLRSTIYSGGVYPANDDWHQNHIGRATAIGSRWVITAPVYQPPGFLAHYESGLWRSENGASGPWVNELSMSYPGLGTGGYAATRQIVLHNGLYYWSSSGNVHAAHCAYSSNGLSWTPFDVGGNSTTAEPLFSYEGVLYRYYERPTDGDAEFPETDFTPWIMASTGPGWTGGPLILSLAFPGTGEEGNAYAVEGDPGKWALIKQGRILLSRPAGWLIDQIGLG